MDQAAYEQLLKLRIDEILYYLWDPIGINTSGPYARNEYDSYADQTWRMVLTGKSRSQISNYLATVIVERMELEPQMGANDELAQLILDWSAYLKEYSDSSLSEH